VPEISILCAFAFIAGLIDAMAGGGGLIQLPALFVVLPGLQPAMLLGTNKLSSVFGTAFATIRYGWSVHIAWRAVIPAAIVASSGALLGAQVALLANPGLFRPILVAALILMAAQIMLRKDFGGRLAERAIEETHRSGIALFAFAIGFYDGFLGPGAGTVMVFGLVRLFGYDFLAASAATKVLNLATNLGALALFIHSGNVLYAVGIPMAFFNILGGLLGAHIAIRRGSHMIRRAFLLVMLLLIAKLVIDGII
jgi:uncharacterized membrane protein YfcA